MFQHLLVPTDGSHLSEATVRRAVIFAKEGGARISFFHALPVYPAMRLGLSHGVLQGAEKFEAYSKEEASRALGFAGRLCEAVGVPCDTISAHSDDPAMAILTAAKECGADLIFMASHGRRGIKSLLMGSETNKVLTHAKIPVLVYR